METIKFNKSNCEHSVPKDSIACPAAKKEVPITECVICCYHKSMSKDKAVVYCDFKTKEVNNGNNKNQL